MDPSSTSTTTDAVSSTDTPDARPADAPLPERIGRFRVDRVLGQGGMGVVYAGHDLELHRAVALKLLRPDLWDTRASARLRREARAMARLNHPNIVPVFEIGDSDGRTFIAMELVEGTTLREWIASRRSIDDIRRVFAEAGRGLLAAHDAGLVHCDFKPANVLLGADGRARVTDFGLVQPSRSDSAEGLGEGVRGGTPAYMAPELRRGAAASEASDQWSFCIALHEALTGQRTPDVSRSVPGWLRRVLARGLSPRPEDRWPSLAAVVDRLRRGPRRPFAPLAAGAAVVVAAGAFILWPRADACADATARLASVWSPDRRAELVKAFAATAAPAAAEQAATAVRNLDRWAAAWQAARGGTCRPSQPRDDRLDARSACLDRKLGEVETATGALVHADARTVVLSPDLVAHLPELADCDDAGREGVTPPVASIRDAVKAARQQHALAKTLARLGREPEALMLNRQALESARRLAYEPLQAEILAEIGSLQHHMGDLAGAKQSVREALALAEASSHDRAKAHDWLRLATLAQDEWKLEEAHQACRYAEAAFRRAEASGISEKARAQFQSDLAETEAGVFMREVAYDRADELMTKADQLDERADTPKVTRAGRLSNHGSILSSLKRFDEAEAMFRRAMAFLEEGAAESYPLYRVVWMNITDLRQRRGDQAGALESVARAIALGEKYLPPDALPLAQAYLVQGDALTHVGKDAAAKASLLRGIAIVKSQKGPRPVLGYGYVLLAKALLIEGNAAEALATIERGRAILEKITVGPENQAGIDLIYAEALWKARKDPRAKELVTGARKMAEETGNADNIATADTLARSMR